MSNRLALALALATLPACGSSEGADASATEYIILLGAAPTSAEPAFELVTEAPGTSAPVLGRVTVDDDGEPMVIVTLQGIEPELVLVDGEPRLAWWGDEPLDLARVVDEVPRLALRVADEALDASR